MGVFLGFPHRISRTPLVQRRGAALARLIAKARAGLHLNNYLAEPGEREAEEDWGGGETLRAVSPDEGHGLRLLTINCCRGRLGSCAMATRCRLGSCSMTPRAHHRFGGALAVQRASTLEPDREGDPGQSGHRSVRQAARIQPRGSCIPSRRPRVIAPCVRFRGAATMASDAAGDNLITRVWVHVNVLN